MQDRPKGWYSICLQYTDWKISSGMSDQTSYGDMGY